MVFTFELHGKLSIKEGGNKMVAIASKVVGVSNNSVYQRINTFLDKLYLTSEHKIPIQKTIERFFMWYVNKSLNEITKEDLQIENE